MNHFFIVGRVDRITQNKKREGGKGGSAMILLKYGPEREVSNGPVEFVNAVVIRVPAFRFEAIGSRLEEGAVVSVTGHVQGIVKGGMGETYMTQELVADNIRANDLDFLFEDEEPETA
ncbi:hypothetical protein A6M27_17020 [Acidithiobacillus thiooxidans]|jgi:hypothetical protein|uniref:Single-stranded DNA-binding protein n=1 Tax=Acidithiobacillus thiooxidans TaxID=930 RepID=A0A1C2IYM7_ACITH|nr:hypothetical protein [Acidithiobacillus thiooxidans]OCX68696.1 hypothetical protein A6P07_17730 [Acidithiobacillus thiooxidans]OCX71554.1 hypothetical protein A6O24_15330 [Acidithiobacillus thiooxidans]OCX81042.1 hypothetical protein A6O26_13700 [Acidithiobacillus thiooxidans]OCX83796.1 hypothetical protein A6M27_17020 [Acidithiobacillus thiooxidans]OFC50282.1 hypothetical protein BAE47_03005 [Acidithiobacillus thiooxidans]